MNASERLNWRYMYPVTVYKKRRQLKRKVYIVLYLQKNYGQVQHPVKSGEILPLTWAGGTMKQHGSVQ